MNSPFVSFIIPYFNAGSTIQETIDSIFNQSYPNFDIWLINDGSTDPYSIGKLKEFEGNEKIHVLHQENAGPSVARNVAIEKTNADYILPMDADNTIIETSLNQFIEFAKKNPEFDAYHGDIIYFGQKNDYFKREDYNDLKSILVSQIDTCALIRKSVFEKGIFYDVYLSKLGLEDWEFWINFHNKGLKSKYISSALFNMRVEFSSRTYQVANKNLIEIKDYVFIKHIRYLSENYNTLFYQKKQLLETPDYRIGKLILKPYRVIKKIIKNAF
jgi:glycosyltransferase involved in cell wall biosynthesis